MYKLILKISLLTIFTVAGFTHADEFKLTSTDIAHGEFMSNKF